MKNKIKLVVAVMFLSLSCSSLSFDGEKRREGHLKKVFKQLNLSNEQMEKIKKHRKNSKEEKRKVREEIKNLKDQIKKAFLNKESDEKMSELHTKMLDLRSKMADTRFSKMLLLKNTLDEEQRKKFMELKGDKRKGHRRGRGH